MVNLLNQMYENVEKLKDYEENKQILEEAIQEHKNRYEELQVAIAEEMGANRKSEMEKDLFKIEATIQHLQNRVQNQKETDELEVSLLKGKFQIETKYEQLLGDYNQQIAQLKAQLEEEKVREEESMQNVQNKMQQYLDLDRENVPEEVRAKALREIDNLDANRENVKAYYEGQYAGMNAKIEEVEAEKNQLVQFAEPILAQAKYIVTGIQQKENRLKNLQELVEEGQAFQTKRKFKEEVYEVAKADHEIDTQLEGMEQATLEEEEQLRNAFTTFGATKAMTNNIIPKEIGDEETMKEMHEEVTELPKQKIENITIDIKTGKVYIALEPKKEEQEKKYKMVETIDFEQETELQSMDLMEETKIEVLKKYMPDFGKACQAMEKAKKEGVQDKEAIVAYHECMDMFQDIDPIVVNTLAKLGRGDEIQQYVKAVVAKDKEEMPFDLDYDLKNMKDTEFNLAQKENILYYAKANRHIADEIKGLTSANMHISFRKFEQKHVWLGKIMHWIRAEENKTLPQPENNQKVKPDFKEEMKAQVSHEQALENLKDNRQEPVKETEQEK